MEEQTALIFSETIQLDQLIKWLGLAETGGQARWLIDEQQVSVNGKVVMERRKKIHPGDVVEVAGQKYRVEIEKA